MKVFDLIDHEANAWRWNLITSMLNDQDKNAIVNMPVVYRGGDDKRAWKYTNKGTYTVKSAYRYAMETLIDNDEYRIPGDWNGLWSLQIPQRIKIFLWRIVRGCFPARDRLQRRGVQCTDACPFCENHYENEWHLFLGCGKAKEIWMTAGLWDGLSHFMPTWWILHLFSSTSFRTGSNTMSLILS
jgi:hypothetical protein